jgi:Domain of unknown function (DUF4349)
MKRHKAYLILAPTLLLAACQQADESTTQTEALNVEREMPVADIAAEEAADASAMKAPGIPASAAPNLAFEYRYAFKLPDDKIGAVQEEHAEACEVLGSARCQIVDYRYAQAKESDVEAMLAFKLDPAIARKFGRDAIASVEKAEGMLSDGNVTGTNVGGQIEDSQGRSALLQAQLERLELRLKAKLPPKERASLQERAEEIRRGLDNEADGRGKGEIKLAMTPVQFTYTSDGGVPGFGKDNPFASAFDVSATSFATMISFVLMVAGALAPWLLLLFLIVLALRSNAASGLRRWWNRNTPLADKPASD